jgi:hypothetical protein
LGNPYCL